MNKFTLTVIAAMFSVNAFAVVATPGFGPKDEPAKSSHTTSCPFSKPSQGRHVASKSPKATVTSVVASSGSQAADSVARAKK